MSNSITTIKIADLLPEEDGIIKYSFFIPKYQRGYRWKDSQIIQLLDDIREFKKPQEGDDSFYCLQPLVVKKGSDSSWIVIDGQQRLTSIFIIYTCIRKIIANKKSTVYKITYENHDELWECLESLDDVDVDKVVIDETDINKYHITAAYNAVYEYFKPMSENQRETLGGEIRDKITNYTRFIWYQVEDSSNPEDIFTDINMGKIRLTNAELIKAMLLQKDNYIEGEESRITSQAKISTAWDSFESTLSEDSFWRFLTNNNDFNYDTKIELLFEIWINELIREDKKNETSFYFKGDAEKAKNKDTYTYIILNRYVQKLVLDNPGKKYSKLLDDFIWHKVTSIFNMLQDWYKRREWYHLIGYIISSTDASNIDDNKASVENKISLILQLKELYEQNTKDKFVNELKKMILLSLIPEFKEEQDKGEDILIKLQEKDIEDLLCNLSYGKTDEEIRKILLLFNVITTQNNKKSAPRFAFMSYKKQNWDIEHIHAQTTDLPTKKAHKKNWLEVFAERMDDFEFIDDETKQSIKYYLENEDQLETEKFNNLCQKLINDLDINKDNSSPKANYQISNLTLLDDHVNRSYKNAVFPVKRITILEKSGTESFIPICTRNVFLKFYTPNAKEMYRWNEEDREKYFDAIKGTIYNYLKFTGEESDYE